MSASTTEEKMEANNQLNELLGKFFAISEAYPELKANTSLKSYKLNLWK